MKKLIIIIPLLLIVVFANAQSRKVKERDLKGTWKLNIDIDMDDIEDELEDEDNVFARIVLKSVSGLVDGILDELEIYFEFQDSGRLKVMVNGFGADEVEYSKWYINRRGELIIEDTDSFNTDRDDYWKFDGSILVAYDEDGRMDDDARVYLVNVD